MNYKLAAVIPEIQIIDYKKDSSQLLVIDLEELLNFHKEIIKNPHRICYYQLLFIIEGGGNLWIDSNKYIFKDKTMLAVSKGQIQIMEFNKNIKGFALIFSEEYLYKYPQDLRWINNLLIFNHSLASPIIKLPVTEYLELVKMLSKIKAEISLENSFANDEIIFSLLKIFLLIIERIKRTDLNINLHYEGEWFFLTEFKKQLEEHYFCSRSVKYYADLLSITPRKLNKITFDGYGKPAKRVIEERTLLEIKRLLVHTEQTIKEIGNTLGFNDPTNFIKFFKKFIKETPSEFRTFHKKT
jgi:AraC-like DNA-binding protein